MKERDYLWDNIKAMLIFFVVAGHCLEMNRVNNELAQNIDSFIYSFHMPAFVFVSGFFAKRYCADGRVRAVKAGTVLAYYIVFQLFFMILRAVFNIYAEHLTLFSPSSGLWYLLALFFYYLITPVVEKLPAWLVIPVSVIFALCIGNDLSATNYLAVLRTFTFAPYFFIGYYLSTDTVKKVRAMKWYLRFPIAAVCVAASVCIWMNTPWITWNKLFFGKVNNIEMKTQFLDASLCRLWVYVIALLMIAALVLAVPNKKSIVSKVGQNSLQIYILHMLIVVLLFVSDWIVIEINDELVFWLCMLGSLGVTVVLSLWFFGYPFRWIQMLVHKIYSLKKAS